METVKVGLIGFGTIGSGVARILLEKQDHLARHAGKRLELVRVVDKDLTRQRNVTLPEGILSDDLDALVNDPEVAVVVQLVGGSGISRDIMLSLLESAKTSSRLIKHSWPIMVLSCLLRLANLVVRSPSKRLSVAGCR